MNHLTETTALLYLYDPLLYVYNYLVVRYITNADYNHG